MEIMEKKGFTLIEMLVVVAIIGILAALLMPGLRQSLEYARQLSCLHNLKQIGVAHQMFPNDNNGELTPAEWADEGNWGGLWNNWAGFLTKAGYINPPRREHNSSVPGTADSVLRCPSGFVDQYADQWGGHAYNSDNAFRPGKSGIPDAAWWSGELSEIDVWYGNNGHNCVGSNFPTWRVGPDDAKPNGQRDYNNRPRLRYVRHPSSTVSTFDGAYPTFYCDPNAIARRHGRRDITNVLFWDGHAISAPLWDLPMPEYPGNNWNSHTLNQVNPKIKWLLNQ